MFTATLTNWSILVGGNNSQHPGQRVLTGTAYNHTHWDVRDGTPIRTNAIVGWNDNEVLTASGSTYTLEGPACQDYETWLAAQAAGFRGAVRGYTPVAYPPAVTEVD